MICHPAPSAASKVKKNRSRPMVATKIKPFLGHGVYTISEAALYARVPPQLMSRWLFGSASGESVIHPQIKTEEKLVTFLDWVQTLAIREIRIQKKIPLYKFRQAIKTAKDYYRLSYPFARNHCTYLWNGDLVIKKPDDKEFLEASGKHRGQILFSFVESYLEKLDYSNDGLAALYRIYKSQHDVEITMNPQIHFGEPMLPSGYSAMSIWESIKAEGGIEQARKAYGISKEEVEASYGFVVDHLGKSAA
jgi:hypothetical protein